MNEKEAIDRLLKLRFHIDTHFRDMREYLNDQHSSINGLIDGEIDRINDSVAKMLDKLSEEDFKYKHRD